MSLELGDALRGYVCPNGRGRLPTQSWHRQQTPARHALQPNETIRAKKTCYGAATDSPNWLRHLQQSNLQPVPPVWEMLSERRCRAHQIGSSEPRPFGTVAAFERCCYRVGEEFKGNDAPLDF